MVGRVIEIANIYLTYLGFGIPFDISHSMLQLNPPLVRVIVGGPGWDGPTGKGVANLVEPGHRDDDIVWIIDLDENGQTWCVPNRYVRVPGISLMAERPNPLKRSALIPTDINGIIVSTATTES